MRTKTKKTNIGERIDELIQDAGTTREHLAEQIGVTPDYLSMIVRGKRNLTLEKAQAITNLFPGVRVQWLLCLDDFKYENDLTHSIIQFHQSQEDLTDELIRSHGYSVIRSEDKATVTITSPSGQKKTVSSLQFLRLIDSINDHIEGQMLLGFHKTSKDFEYTGRCW